MLSIKIYGNMGILEELPMTTGERIKFFRENNKITQKSFAIAIGISQTHISKIENNKDNPSEKLLHSIAAAFSINYEWLKYGTGDIMVNRDKEQPYSYNQCLYDIKQFENECKEEDFQVFLKQIKQLMELYKQNKYFNKYIGGLGYGFMSEIISNIHQLISYWIDIDKKYRNMSNNSLSYNECSEINKSIYETTDIYINKISIILNYFIPMIFASWKVMEEYIDISYENEKKDLIEQHIIYDENKKEKDNE